MLMDVLAGAVVATCRRATGEHWQKMNIKFVTGSICPYSLILNVTSISWRDESMAVPHDQSKQL